MRLIPTKLPKQPAKCEFTNFDVNDSWNAHVKANWALILLVLNFVLEAFDKIFSWGFY